MKLDFTSFEKAINSFKSALDFIDSEEFKSFSEDKKNVIKAGVIQNFEFTYELSWKFIQRYLKENINKETVEGLSRRELFKYAKEKKLIEDIDLWLTFHQARNETSHTYYQEKSEEIIKIAKIFLPEFKKLLLILKSKNE